STVCKTSAAWLYCSGAEGARLAPDATASMWDRVAKDLPVPDRGAELMLYAPLDTGLAAKALEPGSRDADGPPKWFSASRAAYLPASLGESRIRLRASYLNPLTTQLTKYFAPEPKMRTLLGAAATGRTASRLLFSPSALWSLVAEKVPAATLD